MAFILAVLSLSCADPVIAPPLWVQLQHVPNLMRPQNPKQLLPEKRTHPKVERYKAELAELIDKSIADAEEMVEELKREGADEERLSSWKKYLASLRETRRDLQGSGWLLFP